MTHRREFIMRKWIAILALVATPAFADPPTSQPGSQPSSQAHGHDHHGHDHSAHDHHGHAGADKPTPAGQKLHKGAAFTVTDDKQITLDAVAAAPNDFAGKTVRVKGKISKVCQAKGCWMAISDTAGKHTARITFKDYAFFVPKDVAGRVTSVEGTIKLKKLSEAMRKHLAKDEGTDVSNVPEVELRMVATGVEIR